MVDLWVEIVGLATLIGLSSFFSGLEVALVGTRDAKVNQLRQQKVRGAESLYRLKSNPGWMMSSVNLGNNLANVGSSALATSVALRLFGDDGLAIAIGVMTLLILIFGEITPKTYCNANATKVALRFAGVLLVFSYAFWPIVKMFEFITRFMVRLTGSSYRAPPITEDDIRGIVEQGLKDKALEKEETELVHGALLFDDITIQGIMTPRTKLFSLSNRTLLIDALPEINHATHSRIPIYDKNPDDIVGFVHVKDILVAVEENYKVKTLGEMARKPVFVSQDKKVSSLLKEMKTHKIHIAIVIDEHGGVDGIVTLEDLIETIVGDIEDETDTDSAETYEIIDKYTILGSGDIRVSRINGLMNVSIPEDASHVTLNGVLHKKLNNIPKVGDSIKVDGVTINVEDVTNNKAVKVRIVKDQADEK